MFRYRVSRASCILIGLCRVVFGKVALLNVTVCLGGVDGDRECSRVVFVLLRLGSIRVVFFFFINRY